MKTPQSRRSLLAWLAAAPLLAFLGSARAEDGKAKKSDMKYQEKPNNGQRCGDCIHFIPGQSAKAPGACKIVEGPISPGGWCIEFQKK
jgi:hypothetical protein